MKIPICQADRSAKSRYFSLFLPCFTHLLVAFSHKRTHFCKAKISLKTKNANKILTNSKKYDNIITERAHR